MVSHVLYDKKEEVTAEAWLPRSRMVKDNRTHYVLTNSVHYVRALTLNGQGLAMIDHQSIQKEFSLSNSSLARLDSVFSDDKLKLVADYDKMQVEFGDAAGVLEIYVSQGRYVHSFMRQPTKMGSQGGDSSRFPSIWSSKEKGDTALRSIFSQGLFLPGQAVSANLTDKLLVNIVHNVDIQPKHKTIFFSTPSSSSYSFPFKIIHGSGDFLVSLNDSTLADKQVQGRTISIVPKRPGTLLLTVQDADLPLSTPTTATLHISAIASLHLHSAV